MRRLLTLLLCALIGLGGAGGALAAPTFPDLTGSAAAADIISLHALGVIDGYPDGTFRPDAAITRAEFAAIVVKALGKSDSADLLRDTATRFSDVGAGQWFTGAINVAVASGISKGCADGTFRPDERISQAEAAAMLLRAMGYNDSLPGDWPLNYVTEAAILGIIGDGFAADALASRAFVATAVTAMLNLGTVTYDTTRQAFSEPAVMPLLAALGAKRCTDAVVTDYDAATDELIFTGTPAYRLPLAAGAVVVTDEALDDLIDRRVSYIERAVGDTTEIIYIEPETPVVSGRVAAVDAEGGTVTLADGTVIKLAEPCAMLKNGAPAAIVDAVGSDLTALIDHDGRAYRLLLLKLDIAGRLTSKAIRLQDGAIVASFVLTDGDASRSFTVPGTATVIRNGAVASFVDLRIGDDIRLAADGSMALAIDAFARIKEATIIGYTTTVAGDEPVVRVDFADGTSLYVDAEASPLSLNVGWFTAFGLNRDGRIAVKLRESPYAGALDGPIATVGTTVTSDGTTRWIALAGGAALPLAETAQVHLNLDDDDFASLEEGQIAQLWLNGAGKVQQVHAYINGAMPEGYFDLLAPENLTADAKVTLNGLPASIDDVWWEADRADVIWDPVVGLLTSVRGYDFTNTGLTVTGTTVADDGSGGLRYSVQVVGGSITLPAGVVIERDGRPAGFPDISCGDKIDVGKLGGSANKFVRLTSDTAFRADDTFTGAADITVTAQVGAIHLHFADAVASLTLYINATLVSDPPLSADRREATVAVGLGLCEVGVVVFDCAGNLATLHCTVTVDSKQETED